MILYFGYLAYRKSSHQKSSSSDSDGSDSDLDNKRQNAKSEVWCILRKCHIFVFYCQNYNKQLLLLLQAFLWPFVLNYLGELVPEETFTHSQLCGSSSFISFLHLLQPIASSLFNLRAWQSFCTTSVHVLTMIIPRWCWWCWQDQWYRVLLVHVMNAALSTRWPLHQQSDLMWTVSPLEMAATIGSHHCHLLLLLVPTDNTHFIFTPCPEKNGTNNVLGITLANTNI